MLKTEGYTQLFVDNFIIENTSNIKRTTNTVNKYPNPVIIPDRQWEGRRTYMFGTVRYIPEERLFKAWYVTNYWIHDIPSSIPKKSFWGATMYAESGDGINWNKPSLGITNFGGSYDNNIIKFCNYKRFTQNIIYRPDIDDSSKRYQMMYCKKDGGYTAYSADGKHWQPLNKETPSLHSDDVLCVTWDPLKKQYIAGYKLPNQDKRRQGFATSKDFENWKYYGLAFEADEKDPEDMEMYGFTPFSYQNMYLGLLWRYRADTAIQTMDQELVYSRDGVKWYRDPSRHAFIPVGGEEKWDSHMIMGVSSDIVQYNNEIRIYYSGWNEKHWLFRDTPNRKNSIGLAVIGKDRWVSLKAENEGEVITKLLEGKGKLFINARTEKDGFVKVEILDSDNRPIKGLCEKNCITFSGDSLDHEVKWDMGKTYTCYALEESIRQPLKIRFILNKAEIFAFRFSK